MVLLDIRSKEEWCKGHVCGAIHIPTALPPLSPAQKNQLRARLVKLKLRRSTPIHVYCKKGIRADIAVRILRSLGYGRVKSLGGIQHPPLSTFLRKSNQSLCTC